MEEKKTDVKIEISLPHNAGRNSVETAKKQMKEWIEKAEELEKEHSVNCTLCFKAQGIISMLLIDWPETVSLSVSL